MHLRATSLLAIVAAGSLLVAGCSGDDTAAPASGGGVTAATVPAPGTAAGPTPNPSGDPARPLKVAILRPAGETTAGPWSFGHAGAEGLRAAVAADGHVELADIAGPTADEARTVVQKLCDDRYDLVIGHGVEFVDPLTAVAATCAGTAFLTTGGTAVGHPPTANVDDWSVSPQDVGYPLGLIAAAAVAPGARIGVVAGADGDAERATTAAFRAALATANPTATTDIVLAASATDPAAGADAARTALGAGATFLFCTGDAVCAGVAEAAGAAGVPVAAGLAAPLDATPATTLAATPLALESLYRDVFHLVRQGRWGNVTFRSTVENEQVDVVVNAAAAPEGLVATVAELSRIADDLAAGLRSGAVKLPDVAT
jgi:basic membrane protein A